jgi:peptidoglycan/LPS O-acetylase OafA/YrhL
LSRDDGVGSVDLTDADANVASAGRTELPAVPEAVVRVAKRDHFRPDIEGLRAVAVVAVVLHHVSVARGGYIGVDIFFVISGFLITRLLLDETTKSGRISIAHFYARRVRRILPAATVTILATIFAAYHWLGPSAGNRTADEGSWAAIFCANIHFSIEEDAARGVLSISPLYHLWSLGVEEQFYLIWPGLFLLLILSTAGARRRSSLAISLTIIIIASFALSIALTPQHANWAYESTLSRAWQLALGAVIAVLAAGASHMRPRWLVEIVSLTGAVGLVSYLCLVSDSVPYPGWIAAWPTIAAGLLIAAGCTSWRTVTGRLLASRPLQWIGARSYSLYLWHLPFLIIAAQHSGHLSAAFRSVCVVLIVITAALSYRFVENPIRHNRYLKMHTAWTLALGCALIAATIATAQVLIAAHT